MSEKQSLSASRTEEAGLIQRSQNGDADAFARLYDTYLARIYRYVYFRVTDRETAEDITSQTFLKAWESMPRYKHGSVPFVAWLYRIAHNAVIDHYRVQKKDVMLDDASATIASPAEDVDARLDLVSDVKALRAALSDLPEDLQQVLLLRFIGETSTAEIAQQLGKQPGAVRVMQMRALRRLAAKMGLEKESSHE